MIRAMPLVMMVTFGLTVVIDLTVALEIGMVLAAFLFMKRMADVTNVQAVTREFADGDEDSEDPLGMQHRALPDGVEVYEINGPFFFGAAQAFKDQVESVLGKPKVLILRMRNVPAMDSSGLHALGGVVRRSQREGTLIVLSGVQPQPRAVLERSVLLDTIGAENICGDIDAALARARSRIATLEAL